MRMSETQSRPCPSGCPGAGRPSCEIPKFQWNHFACGHLKALKAHLSLPAHDGYPVMDPL